MTQRANAGFTLLELLLSTTISAIVLTSAVVSLNSMVEADARATQGIELSVGVDRALRTFVQDLRFATAAQISGDRLVLEYEDSSAVIYERTPTQDELHRVTGDSESAATAAADALTLTVVTAAVRTSRGHLRDADYRASAILQGITAISWIEIVDSDGDPIGVKMKVSFPDTTGAAVASAAALRLAEVTP